MTNPDSRQSGKVAVTRLVPKTEYVDACPECDGAKRVFAHDPCGDGHGGLNGGRWSWFPCSCGDGSLRGYERAKESRDPGLY